MLPFSREQFIAIFVDYNGAVWPTQVLAYVLGLGVVVMLVRPSEAGGRLIAAGLAAMWIWTGVAYHWLYFSAINQAAWGFGALFVLQGIAFLYVGAIVGRLRFDRQRGMTSWLGWALVAYAAVAYPLVGMWAGHRYPEMPMFGITPCPVTIFTFGVMLLAASPVPRWLLMIPFVWSLIGGSAAFLLGVRQDWLLLVSSVSAVAIVVRDRARLRQSVMAT